jgi:hypothetical protein
MRVVAEYQGKPTLDMYSNILNSVGREYGNCLVVVENNSLGISVLEKLVDLEYPNLYYSVKSSHEYVEQLQGEHMSNAIAGFTTSSKTRPLIIAKLEEFVRNKLIITHSSRLINELTTFIWHNGKPQAMRGYNDDLVMSLAIACWVKETALEVNQREAEYQKAFLSSMTKSNSHLNTTIPGMLGYRKNKTDDALEKHKKNLEQFSWIYKG